MLPYWLLFVVFALGAFSGIRRTALSPRYAPMFFLAMLTLVLMIGLRFETGGDWKNYDAIFDWSGRVTTSVAMNYGDPGYMALNVLAHRLDVGIWLVNLICALLFVWGLVRFAEDQPNPWLACAVAVPYLVIVVVMGYTRQGVAIGMLMAALPAFQRHRYKTFAAYFLVAVLFHKTAIVMLPLIVLSTTRHRFVVLFASALLGGAGLLLLLNAILGSLLQTYVGSEMESDGAGVRLAMNLVAALVFLPAQRRFVVSEQERLLWRNFALLTLVLAIALFVSPSTTAVDRISLYLFPFQIFVLSRLPMALSPTGKMRGDVMIGVLAYLAAIQFVWLFFASNARWWIPYQMV